MPTGRRWWLIVVLGLVVLSVVPFAFAASWKRALAGALAFLLASFWVLLWIVIREPRRRTARVAIILGVIGGLVLGVLGVGLYCGASDCAAGFDALVLVPAGALLGAVVGGVVGSVIGARTGPGPPGPHPRHPPDLDRGPVGEEGEADRVAKRS